MGIDFGRLGKAHYVLHNGCRENWISEPFPSQQEAEQYRDTLLDSADHDSCPACGGHTPDASHYTVLKIV